MTFRCAALAVVVAGLQAAELAAQSANLNQVLARVVENVANYHATLPSITADEDIISSLSQHGLYRARGTAHSTLRVTSGGSGERLDEVRTYLVLDGKAVPSGKKVSVPFELNGAFSRVADTFFSASHVPCYSFSVLPEFAPDGSIQLAFTTGPQPPTACQNRNAAVTGLARIDPATMQIRHLERKLTGPLDGHHTTFIAIDYAPAQIGGRSIWLPTFLTAELDFGKGSFSARYSNYHRYTGTVTVLPGITPSEEVPPETAANPLPRPAAQTVKPPSR